MRSLASTARLLDACTSIRGTEGLLSALGFTNPVPVADEHNAILALPVGDPGPVIARGEGSLRALVFACRESGELRSILPRVAARLASCAPGMFWLVVGIDSAGETAVAAFDSTSGRLRVASLIARPGHVVASDAETINALAAVRSPSDVLVHCRWLEILGRESLNRRFFQTLERCVSQLAQSLSRPVASAQASELALLHVSRLLFLSFLETKGWLDNDHAFLGNQYGECMLAGGRFHQRVLAPLYFGTLNTPPAKRATRARSFGRIPFLNGGLFMRSPLERLTATSFFSDEAIGDLFGDLLTRYRFTAREDSARWSEAAVDPEMLGKAFESLMSALDRKKSGAFYTPQSLVVEVSRSALSHALASASIGSKEMLAVLDGEIPRPYERERLLARIADIRVLDPACGSGAFLVHVMEDLSSLRVRLGDTRALHVIRREILTRGIFGVDVNPTAAWLCELRLWLSMAIEDPERNPLRVTPLPNLDRNIRVGDSLLGQPFNGHELGKVALRFGPLRSRYARATGTRKRSLARLLDSVERGCALTDARQRTDRLQSERREILCSLRSPDLFGDRPAPGREIAQRLAALRAELRVAREETRRIAAGAALPFSFATRFADVAAGGGFDVVIGNPPWVRTHNLDSRSRAQFSRAFVSYRNASWSLGRVASGAGQGFSSQVDAAAMFVERSVELLRPEGVAALVVPAKLWRSLAGGGIRAFLQQRTRLRELGDLSSAPQLFDAAVYPSVVVATSLARRSAQPELPEAAARVLVSTYSRGIPSRWESTPGELPFDRSDGSPWLLVPAQVRIAFERLSGAGLPLWQSSLGRPLLGVKTGCNDAFLVSSTSCEVDSRMLRPVIRGERVTRWRIESDESRIVWTHDSDGSVLGALPPATHRWLSRWRYDLERRSDMRGAAKWWTLFRTEGAASDCARVVWADIGRVPRAAVLGAGDRAVPLNSCYVTRCKDTTDACALAALLNCSVIAAWLAIIAEPARGGYHRYLGWTMSMVPVPRAWDRARSILAPLTRSAIEGREPSESALREAVLDAFMIEPRDVETLLKWTG